MGRTALIQVVLALVLCGVFAAPTLAISIRPKPDHGWTVRIGSGYYGLEGYGSVTYLYTGSGRVRIPLPFYVTLALAALPGVILVTLGLWQAHRRKPERT
jgi:hypothetical protein